MFYSLSNFLFVLLDEYYDLLSFQIICLSTCLPIYLSVYHLSIHLLSLNLLSEVFFTLYLKILICFKT